MRRRFAMLRALAAVAGGLLLVTAFPPIGLDALAPVAVALLTLAVRGTRARRGAWLGLLFGLAFFVPLLRWTGIYVGPVPWLILATAEAAYVAGQGALLSLASRLPGWPVWSAALWVLQEAVRSRQPFGGFPWGRLAFSQADLPVVGLAALGGAPLVTFATALSGGLLAWAAVRGRPLLGRRRALESSRRPLRRLARRRPALPVALGALGALAVVAAGALVPTLPASGRTATVALVQGNVPRLGLDFNAQREAVLRYHVQATLDLAADVAAGRLAKPQLVVWPENSSDIDPLQEPDAAELISSAAQAVGVPILVGAVLDGPGPDHITNAGIVWDPVTGPGAEYVKRHPVPFGEYIPLRRVARLVSSDVDLVARDMVAGHRVGVLDVARVRLGDLICFEVAYDGLVRDVVRGGGEVITVQTNNATFGRSGESSQQLEMSRVRAVEHGREVLIAATSGISAVVGPDGAIQQSTQVFTRRVLEAQVPLQTRITAADRVGAWPEAGLAGAGLAAALASVVVAQRTRPSRAPGAGQQGRPAPLSSGRQPTGVPR